MTASNHPHDHCRDIREAYPYPVFGENNTQILSCGNTHCTDAKGKPYYPVSTTCVNLKCEQRFRPVCPATIYCSQQCFEATDTLEQWNAAKAKLKKDCQLEHTKQLAKERHIRYLHTDAEREHRREQNQRCYLHRKETGKIQAAYKKHKLLQSRADTCEFANAEHPFSIKQTKKTKSTSLSSGTTFYILMLLIWALCKL